MIEIEALEDIDRIALAADWVELSAMMSARRTASAADLIRSVSILDEPEHEVIESPIAGDEEVTEPLEEEILESRTELWAAEVREELWIRQASLGDAYPFALDGSSSSWTLAYKDEADRHDHLFYSCCLLITARRHRLIKCKIPEMDKVLQVIAYLVAANIVHGKAYWFGWPRPDDTGKMIAAVERLITKMGFESPRLVDPVWSSSKEKDGGIDVVAWKDFHDGLPARLVLYGQVASGKDWDDKSVVRYASGTFRDWVREYGQKFYVPAMFIPWHQYVLVGRSPGRSFRRRVLDSAMSLERSMGLTVDRARIAELARPSANTGNDDEATWVNYLVAWRDKVLAI